MESYTKRTNIDDFPDWTIEEFDAIEENHEFSTQFRRKERAAMRRGHKKASRRFAVSVAAAVAAVVLLPIGVYAAMNHSRFFHNAFGDAGRNSYAGHEIEVDTGKGYSITTTIPGKEYVPVDEENAETLVGRYTLDEPVMLQIKDHTVTILSAVRDRNAMVMEYTVECPTGVTMYEYSDSSNERKGAMLNPDGMTSFGVDGINMIYIDLKKSTPECLYCYGYGTFSFQLKDGENPKITCLYADRPFSEIDIYESEKEIKSVTSELPLSSGVPTTEFVSDVGGWMEVSPLACRFEMDKAFEGDPERLQEDGTYYGDFCDMKNVDIYYKDGTHYQVENEVDNIDNTSYVCGGCARSEETLCEYFDAVYVFNRLVDVNEIDYIDINGHIYKRK